jgi:D-sedoheptulose 7-phosphate isomerase
MNEKFLKYRNEFIDTINALDALQIEQTVNLLSMRRAYPIFIIGNGGSAANASHFAQDLFNSANLNAISLCNDISTITAVANDHSYDYIFVKQLERLADQWNTLIAISCSGNSKNIIKAVERADEMNLTVVGFTGGDGGELAELADYPIVVPSNSIRTVESVHSFLFHYITERIVHERS